MAVVEKAVSNVRSPVRRRAGAKDGKKKPASSGRVVFEGDGFTLTWKNDKPMPWANFVVFLTDPGKRKRSFHFAWNGERFNSGGGAEDLELREWEIFEKVYEFLKHHTWKFNRAPKRKRRAWSDDDNE